MSDERLRRAVLVLAALGVGVAGYLTVVALAGIAPVCPGGGGGCARVQASDQSRLLGVPVAVLGLGTYLALLVIGAGRGAVARALAALVALVGSGFSAYLTQQSVAVIGATCRWCLVSAALMTLLAVVSVARLLRGP